MNKKWWHPDHFGPKIPNLRQRAAMMRNIRRFFDDRGYLEVETPALQISGVMDVHIKAFETEYITPDMSRRERLFLHTSPEFAMKKMLVGGADRIYQICKTYRNAEDSPNHSPEFTMLEWYQTGLSYTGLMNECVDLLRKVQKDVPAFRFQGKAADAHQQWQFISVCDSFKTYADIDLESVLHDLDAFIKAAAASDCPAHAGDTWEDLFFRIFLEKIEPHLGHPAPTILYDYPASMASLARKKPEDPRFCERFEIYVCGLELANGFGELCDANEQHQRFKESMAQKKQLYNDDYPIDEELIAALEYGMAEVSGIALGIDRLAMLLLNARTINDVLAVPVG